MKSEHARLHQALAALAPPKRFELLLLMLGGVDRSVSQLASAVKLSQSCTTRHLQALERAGLVKGIRDGKRVVFRPLPSDAPAASVLASLPGGVGEASGPRPPASAPARAISGGNTRPASRVRTPPGAAGVAARPPRRKPASTAIDTPTGAVTAPAPDLAPRTDRPRPIESARATAQPGDESGKNSRSDDAVAPPPRRPRQDLEDFLL